jgi:Flp pilus assembly protein TadD
LAPKNNDAYYYRGLAHASKREFENAIADYTEAITLDPDDAEAFNNRGNAYIRIGETEKAEADFTEAKRLGAEEFQGNSGGNGGNPE